MRREARGVEGGGECDAGEGRLTLLRLCVVQRGSGQWWGTSDERSHRHQQRRGQWTGERQRRKKRLHALVGPTPSEGGGKGDGGARKEVDDISESQIGSEGLVWGHCPCPPSKRGEKAL